MKKIIPISLLLISSHGSLLHAQNTADQFSILAEQVKQLEQKLERLEAQVQDFKKTQSPQNPLSEPMLSDASLIDWAKVSAVKIYDYNYQNLDQNLNNLKPLFTEPGHTSYLEALEQSGNIKLIKDKEISVKAELAGEPKIIDTKQVSDVHVWHVAVPLKVTYQQHAGDVIQHVDVTLEIVRANAEDKPKGVAIHSVSAAVKQEASTEQSKNGI